MDENLAERILRLPTHIRVALATVEGPGWEITRGALLGGAYGPTAFRAVARCGADVSDRYAWWPANPARSVAAVLGCSMFVTLGRLRQEVGYWQDDDHAAALAIIEQHVAAAVPAAHRQSVVNLGAVGEVINLQGPVTISIGADGVKVTR